MVLIMKFEKASRKSHYYDEDRIVIGDNYFMVMDGATPLLKTGIKPSEASWFVSFIKSHLAKNQENILEKLGYTEVYNLKEGIDKIWIR